MRLDMLPLGRPLGLVPLAAHKDGVPGGDLSRKRLKSPVRSLGIKEVRLVGTLRELDASVVFAMSINWRFTGCVLAIIS